MLCHGISTGALFMLVGALQERIHTRDTARMGGLWPAMPRMGGIAMLFALASLGLPGLGNFVGEFLVLLGTYPISPAAAILGTVGLVFAAIYSLAIVQRAFYGPNVEGWKPPDLSPREMSILGAMVAILVWLGCYPQPVFGTFLPALRQLVALTAGH
jgi:NADH-quinone oxidoreductase subunit M